MYSSTGQSPCDVGLALISLCGLPAQAVTNSSCYCNTVTYSMWAACEACHQATWSPFQQYLGLLPCSGEVDIGFYKLPIPDGTVVPHWAYLFQPPETNQSATFDVQLTKQQGCSQSQCPTTTPAATTTTSSSSSSSDTASTSTHWIWSSSTQLGTTIDLPPTGVSLSVSFTTGMQSASSGSPTAASNGSPATSANNTQTNAWPRTGTSWGPDSTSGAVDSSSARKTSKATVIGATVGVIGAAVVGAFAFALVFLRRRRRRRIVPALADFSSGDEPRKGALRNTETDLDESVEDAPTMKQAVSPPGIRPKLYNPDDPTTFPPSLSEILGDERPVLDPMHRADQRGHLPEAPEVY
ncbi:hypothetical protein C8Q73DRAFT_694584 [Cubamyces lactineus]|nr:hypothetical protein C8Q73DRAFT_694584 [Cubamyces lactineus]